MNFWDSKREKDGGFFAGLLLTLFECQTAVIDVRQELHRKVGNLYCYIKSSELYFGDKGKLYLL